MNPEPIKQISNGKIYYVPLPVVKPEPVQEDWTDKVEAFMERCEPYLIFICAALFVTVAILTAARLVFGW